MTFVGIAVVILAASVVYAANRMCSLLQPWSESHSVRIGLLKEKQSTRSKLEYSLPLPGYYPGTPEQQEKKEQEERMERLVWRVKELREDLKDLR